jgi:CrcB protein
VVHILLTFIGCALGGVFRYLGTLLIARFFGEGFPWGTLLVNAVGSFLLGLILGSGFEAKDVWLSSEATCAFAALGFCGGLTTFSTFSLETFSLVSDQAWAKALANILGSVLLCVLCVLSGYAIGEGLTQ